MKFIGLDPGLRFTGWGVIAAEGNRLRHIADGVIRVPTRIDLADRLAELHRQLSALLDLYAPEEAAVEETFVNRNPSSTLKLGQARGVVMSVPALAGVPVFEYAANRIKQSVVGTGHAQKDQVELMIRTLLPGASIDKQDAADALAVAVCHAHHRQSAHSVAEKQAAALGGRRG